MLQDATNGKTSFIILSCILKFLSVCLKCQQPECAKELTLDTTSAPKPKVIFEPSE